jgi:phosphatidylinositol-3-phosphatase
VGHVFLVVLENESYSNIIGNAATLPYLTYLNDLANQYGLATNYFANQHASLGDYFILTTGESAQLDPTGEYSGTITADNVVRELVAAGKTWKSYAESLPSVGYTGPTVYPYAKRHNPFAYFQDVVSTPAQANNMVPFTQFADDLTNNRLPNYSFVVPNLQDDMHDCPTGGQSCPATDKLAAGDKWLRTNIDPLIKSQMFQDDGLLIITFDEAELGDSTKGGGPVATIIVSAKGKPAYKSTTFYQHESTLRLTLEALGVNTFPGKGASAPSMAEFFK